MLNFTQIRKREMKENELISTIISINHSIFDQQISWFTSLSTAMEKHCKKQMQNGEETSWSRLPACIHQIPETSIPFKTEKTLQ